MLISRFNAFLIEREGGEGQDARQCTRTSAKSGTSANILANSTAATRKIYPRISTTVAPMIEMDCTLSSGFAYGRRGLQLLKEIPGISFGVERTERLQGGNVYVLSLKTDSAYSGRSIDFADFGPVLCKHGKSIEYAKSSRLPTEGWEELVDAWSCHNGEFASMLSLELRIRPGYILLSNFYMLADQNVLPECCKGAQLLFYNDLTIQHADSALIYNFIAEAFHSRSSFTVGFGEHTYRLKYFYSCFLISEQKEMKRAIKVGFKEVSVDRDRTDCHLPEYYGERLMQMLNQNTLGIPMLGFNMSFITE